MVNQAYRRIVVKVGSSTLTHPEGGLNLRRIDRLAMVLSDIKNQGHEVILVSSGAVAAGVAKLHQNARPSSMKEKQAAASIGQCELMFLYDKVFAQYGQMISQLLLTKTVIDKETLRINVQNTLSTLLSYGVIPIVNENDSVAVDELAYGDNDTLSALTAKIICADLLILLSDIDGLYDADPRSHPEATFIQEVREIDDRIRALAKDATSNTGTGGMITKLQAAEIATAAQIDMVIANGTHPDILYDILQGSARCTRFIKKEDTYGTIDTGTTNQSSSSNSHESR